MKNVNNGVDVIHLGQPGSTNYALVDPNFMGLMLNEFFANNVLAKELQVLPTQYFAGEAEEFYLKPLLAYLELWKTSKPAIKPGQFTQGYDVLAKNATTFAHMLDILKSKTSQNAYSDEMTRLLMETGSNDEIEDTKDGLYQSILSIMKNKTQILKAIKSQAKDATLAKLVDWDDFREAGMSLLGRGLNYAYPGRLVRSHVDGLSSIGNMLMLLVSPGNYLEHVGGSPANSNVLAQIHQQDVFSAMVAFIHYLRITRDSEQYSIALPNRLSAATQVVMMDTQKSAARELAWYYESLAQLPALYNLYLVIELLSNELEFVRASVDIGDSVWKDVTVQLDFAKSVIDKWLYPWAKELAISQLDYVRDVKEADVLLSMEFADTLKLKKPVIEKAVQVPPGTPPLSDKSFADTRLSSDVYLHVFTKLKTKVADAVEIARIIDHGLTHLGSDLGIQASKTTGLASLSIPKFPKGISAFKPTYRSIATTPPIPTAIPHRIVTDDPGAPKGRRTVITMSEHVYGVIRSLRLFDSMRKKTSKIAANAVTPVSVTDVSLTFPWEKVLPVSGSQGVHYLEMPVPYEYVAHVVANSVNNDISGIMSTLYGAQDMFWKYETYFSVAAALLSGSILPEEVAEPFSAIGAWYMVEGNASKSDVAGAPSIAGVPISFGSIDELLELVNSEDALVTTTSNLCYGVPFSVVAAKSLEDKDTLLSRTMGVYVPSEDVTCVFILHGYAPRLHPAFYNAVQLTTGCFLNVPVSLKAAGQSKASTFAELMKGSREFVTDPGEYDWIRISGWAKQLVTLPHLLFVPSRLPGSHMTGYADAVNNYFRITTASFSEGNADMRHLHLRMSVPSQYQLIEPEDFLDDTGVEFQIAKITVGDPFSERTDNKAAEETRDDESVIHDIAKGISKSSTTIKEDGGATASQAAKDLGINNIVDSGAAEGSQSIINPAVEGDTKPATGGPSTEEVTGGSAPTNAVGAADTVKTVSEGSSSKEDKPKEKQPAEKKFESMTVDQLASFGPDEKKKLIADLEKEIKAHADDSAYVTHLETLLKAAKASDDSAPKGDESKPADE